MTNDMLSELNVKRERRAFSVFNISQKARIEKAPFIKKIHKTNEKEELFVKKIEQGSVVFDFAVDPLSDLKDKEIKRSTLNELSEYINCNKNFLTEIYYPIRNCSIY